MHIKTSKILFYFKNISILKFAMHVVTSPMLVKFYVTFILKYIHTKRD